MRSQAWSDGIRLLRANCLSRRLAARRRLLNEGKGADEFRKMPNRDAGDREISTARTYECPNKPLPDLCLAEKVVLAPGRDAVRSIGARTLSVSVAAASPLEVSGADGWRSGSIFSFVMMVNRVQKGRINHPSALMRKSPPESPAQKKCHGQSADRWSIMVGWRQN